MLSPNLSANDPNAVAMATMTFDIKVIGKTNKPVPVNIPRFLFSTIEQIIKMHEHVGLAGNKYIFGKIGSTDEFRNTRNFLRKQVQHLELTTRMKNLGSQGNRRAAATELMVEILLFLVIRMY